MFTVYIYIYMCVCSKQNTCIACGTPVIYIYIYTQPATLASKYILRIKCKYIYIYYIIINVKYWLPEPATLISKYILSATFWTFYERAWAENTFPPLPSQLLQNFPLPRFKLSVCTSSRETKISGIPWSSDPLYILHHFLCFGSATLASCTLTSCFLARRSFGSCDRIFYID